MRAECEGKEQVRCAGNKCNPTLTLILIVTPTLTLTIILHCTPNPNPNANTCPNAGRDLSVSQLKEILRLSTLLVMSVGRDVVAGKWLVPALSRE